MGIGVGMCGKMEGEGREEGRGSSTSGIEVCLERTVLDLRYVSTRYHIAHASLDSSQNLCYQSLFLLELGPGRIVPSVRVEHRVENAAHAGVRLPHRSLLLFCLVLQESL